MANISTAAPAPSANYIPKLATAITVNNSAIYQNGTNIGIGTTTPAAQLDVAGIIQLTGFRMPVIPIAGYVLTSDIAGNGTWKQAPGVGGGGTVSAISKFTSANAIGDSVINESGGNIGIGTTTPGTKLDVNGTVKLGGTVPVPGVYVNGTGSVGIGTATPSQKLDVNGNINISGSVQALLSILALNGLIGKSTSAATPAGVFDNMAGGKIISGQVNGGEMFSVDGAGNVVAKGVIQSTLGGFKFPDGSVQSTAAPGGGGGSSVIYESGGKVGIGDSTPQEKLTLAPASNFVVEMPAPDFNMVKAVGKSGGNLINGTYYFRIVVEDGAGGLTLPSDPRTPCPINNPATTLCHVTWNPVLGATQYRVYVVDRFDGELDSYYVVLATPAPFFDFNNQGGNTVQPFPSVATAYINKLSAAGPSWLLGGNVGIGTTNPARKLHIEENIPGGLAGLRIRNAAAVHPGWSIVHKQSADASGGSLQFVDEYVNSPRVTLDQNGRVGIGTTDPWNDGRLHVIRNDHSKAESAANYFVSHFSSNDAIGPVGVSVGFRTTDKVGLIQASEIGVAPSPLSLQSYGGGVGIGTTNINGALTISAGQDRVLNVRGDPAAWGLGQAGVILQGVNSAQNAEVPITLQGSTVFINPASGGTVCIGTSSVMTQYEGKSIKLQVQGYIYSDAGVCIGSSKRRKRNIRTIKGALSKIKRLRGISYNQKQDDKRAIGLVAEEVGEVFPEIVTYEENGRDALGLDYSRLVAVLIEAVKEQQGQIEELKDSVKSLLADKRKVAGLT